MYFLKLKPFPHFLKKGNKKKHLIIMKKKKNRLKNARMFKNLSRFHIKKIHVYLKFQVFTLKKKCIYVFKN